MPEDPGDSERTRAFRPEDLEETQAPGDELVGTIFADRYRILRCLGKGAMGAVYEGEHLKIGRRDAIKVLQGTIARDPEATRRFLRGARNASLVRHPNVCAIYDFGETPDDLQFLAMEFVKGESLTDLIQREERLPPERAIPIARQIAAGLQAAHDQGVVHRDLKPDNVMITRARDDSDMVKVVDFDIARGSQEGEGMSVTRTGFVVGTPEYMSPEQLTGDSLSGRSDMYSLGLVLFRMLSGEQPFRATTAQEVMVQRLTKDPISLEEAAPDAVFPPGLQEVLDRALARKPEDRYPDLETFSRALAEVEQALEGGRGPGGVSRAGGATPSGGRPEDAIPPTRAASAAGTPEEEGMALPQTRVSSGEGARVDDGLLNRKWLPIAAVLALLALVGIGGGVFLLQDRNSVASDAPGEVGETAGAVAFDDGEEGEGTLTEGNDPEGEGDRVQPSGQPEPPDPGGGTTGGRQAASTESPGPEPTAPGPASVAATGPSSPSGATSGFALEGRTPRELLNDQLLRLDEGDRSGLLAIRDTTQALWDQGAMSRADSAYAAFVLAQTLIPLGDSIEGVRWLDEAVDLDPQRGYVTLRDLHRGGVR